MFQLTKQEIEDLRFQIESLESGHPSRSQFVTLKDGRESNVKYLPYAFTELGVAVQSGILNSVKAINMNIAIMRAFVGIRKIVLHESDLKLQLQLSKDRLGEHDVQLIKIYDVMENLLDENAAGRIWGERERVGFTLNK